jgi:uncharacterized protein (DUF1800 family)
MDRKEFLTLKSTKATAPSGVGALQRRTSTGLTKYAGSWTKGEVKHLLARCLFGYSLADVNSFLAKGLDTAVSDILNTSSTAPSPPLNNYGVSGNPDPNVTLGQTWVNAVPDPNFNGPRIQSFKSWWYGLMLNQDKTILEKMVLFWHNHLATTTDTIVDPRSIYTHHALLRAGAMGNFKTLVRNVTIDAGMLVFLNGAYNVKQAPDENYARELQELFCVGKGPDSKYTEDDVKAAARVLTGWRVNRGANPVTVVFDVTKHDTADKQFSAFYGNTKITGRSTSSAGDLELDDLLTMIFSQDEVAKFICRKLYRFFVYYNIDATIETDIITPLATELRNNNYDIKPVLQKLLLSEHFYDMANRGCYIKSPPDHLVGFNKVAKVSMPTVGTNGVTCVYDHWGLYSYYSTILNLSIGDPPNVAGWQAWYQAPQFHEIWINSDTLPKRNQFSDYILSAGYTKTGFTQKGDVFTMAAQFSDPSDPNKLVAEALELMIPLDASTALKAAMKALLLPGGIPDYNWTNAWNEWKNNPGNTSNTNTVTYLLVSLFKGIMNLEEYQLC